MNIKNTQMKEFENIIQDKTKQIEKLQKSSLARKQELEQELTCR